MKEKHRVYKERNGKPEIDMTISRNGDLFDVYETVHQVDIKYMKSDEVGIIVDELEVPDFVKLEIKQAILGKPLGFLEQKKQKLDEMMPYIKNEAKEFKGDAYEDYRELEKRIKKELNEMEKRIEDLWNKRK